LRAAHDEQPRSAVAGGAKTRRHSLDALDDVALDGRPHRHQGVPLEGRAALAVVVRDDGGRLRLVGTEGDGVPRVILDQPAGAVDLAVEVEPAVRVRRPPLHRRGVGEAEVDRPVPWPTRRHLERLDDMDGRVPALVDLPLGGNPSAIAKPLLANTGQAV
jgi:hypothetical protein